MNRDRRSIPRRREHRLCVPTTVKRAGQVGRERELTDVAPWVIEQVRAWPGTVDDRLVAVRMGVFVTHVTLARAARRGRPVV